MIYKKLFWNLIEESITMKNSTDKNDQGDTLMYLLTKFPIDQIVGFHNRAKSLREEIESPMMKDIAFMMKYGDNEHAYRGFKNWVISLGEEHFQKAKNSPAHLLTLKDPSLFVVCRAYFEDLDFVSSGAYYTISKEKDADWNTVLKRETRTKELDQKSKDDHEIEH